MNHAHSPRYQVRTAKNQVLPPLSLEELRNWVREGRISPEGDRITQVGSGVWGKVSDYPELGYNAAAARQVIDAELKKTKQVRLALMISFVVPFAIAIGLFGIPSYDATEEIRVERRLASQSKIEAASAVEKLKVAQQQAQEAKRRQDDAERLLKATQEANERLKADLENAAKIAQTIKGGSEQQSQLLSALESQVRRAEAGASKGRIENLELRQRLSRSEENAAALNKELVEVKAQLDAELRKSIVQKVFNTN